MRYAVIAVLSLLFVSPLRAADRFFDLNGFVVWIDPQSSDTFNSSNSNQPFNISFTGKLGYGLGANVFFGDKISIEFAASAAEPTAAFGNFGSGQALASTNLKMIPITAVFQYHFAPSSTFDPYIGAGGAYVLFDQLDNPGDIGHVGVDHIDFKDDVGLALNAGLAVRLTKRVGLFFDAKYVPIETSATAVFVTGPDSEQRIEINPVMAAAGVSIRF